MKDRIVEDRIFQEDLLTPEEAAYLMSQRAGYKVTPEDLKQLRRRGKIRAAKQYARTTLYARAEIVKALPPKKHHPEPVLQEISSFSDAVFLEDNNVSKAELQASWRTLLRDIIDDEQELMRIAQLLQVSPVVIQNWVIQKANPQPIQLVTLLKALSVYPQMLYLIISEYLFNEAQPSWQERSKGAIPAVFYRDMLRLYSHTSHRQTSTISPRIVKQLLDQIDPEGNGLKPRERNIHVGIAQCVPPKEGQKVRSLRKVTSPWEDFEQTRFFGAESLVGRSVTLGRPLIQSEDQRNLRRNLLYDEELQEKSFVSLPIFRASDLAGALYVSSSQANYFTDTHLNIMQDYVDLLAVTLDDNEFHKPEWLDLHVLPEYVDQKPLLEHQAEKIVDIMRNEHRPQKEAAEAVWQELEDLLIDLARQKNQEQPAPWENKAATM